MLDLNDDRWADLRAGYRVPVDIRPLLLRLESDADPHAAWRALWQELYHQGDIGEGSLAAVPHLVRIHRQRVTADWNTYALVAAIELARNRDGNPDLPGWTRAAYELALTELRALGLEELPRARDPETVQSILAVLAVVSGARVYGRILSEFSEDEVLELERRAWGDAESD